MKLNPGRIPHEILRLLKKDASGMTVHSISEKIRERTQGSSIERSVSSALTNLYPTYVARAKIKGLYVYLITPEGSKQLATLNEKYPGPFTSNFIPAGTKNEIELMVYGLIAREGVITTTDLNNADGGRYSGRAYSNILVEMASKRMIKTSNVKEQYVSWIKKSCMFKLGVIPLPEKELKAYKKIYWIEKFDELVLRIPVKHRRLVNLKLPPSDFRKDANYTYRSNREKPMLETSDRNLLYEYVNHEKYTSDGHLVLIATEQFKEEISHYDIHVTDLTMESLLMGIKLKNFFYKL